MDEPYLLPATRYIERNPVRPRLVERAEDWPLGEKPFLQRLSPLLGRELVPKEAGRKRKRTK